MSTVGAFPGLQQMLKMPRKAPVNPMDKASIVSIFPREIKEVKHTIQPGVFIIPPGTKERPSLLVVGPSSWWKELEDEMPPLEIPHSSLQIAHSVVYDWANGLFCCNMSDKMPGIFYVPGEISLGDFKSNKQLVAQIELAYTKQKAWFGELIKQADVVWSRTNGNPLTITEDMKLAAMELGYKDKPWLKDTLQLAMINCPACGALVNPGYPVCGSCKAIINKQKAEELGLIFAK